jgi:tRNA-dihydrouridine synthase B
LIGRGGLGNPWFFKQVEHYLKTGEKLPEPTKEEIFPVMRKHAQIQIDTFGERGLIKLRKHLPWYVKRNPELKHMKEQLVKVTTLEDLEQVIG